MRTRLLPAALLASGLLLSGCGTGLQATTYTKEKAPRDFSGATAGDLDIRNLGIAPPSTGIVLKAGDHATLTGSFVNTGTVDDKLVSVSSDAAATATVVPGGTATDVTIPAGGDADTWSADLVLKADTSVGQYLTVTLVFERAGTVTDLQVPIRSGDTGLSSRAPEQDPYGSGE
ncbi:MAG: hypothetical protein JWO22_3132 [Frankiales bacterium]|nr:hypothetical protein [Frankiales bacterium]